MKKKKHLKSQILYTFLILFSGMTVCLVVYALLHRSDSDLIYVILSAYALATVLLGLFFVLYSSHVKKRDAERSTKRLHHLVKNLSSPAMLWTDNFKVLVINDRLANISEVKMQEDFNARYIVPFFFGKKEMSDEDIREIVLEKNKEYSFTTETGIPHDVIWNTSSLRTDDDGTVWFLSIGLDLGEIRHMQSELEAVAKRLSVSEGRHQLTMDLMDFGILLIEHGNPNLFPSEKLIKMLGFTTNTITLDQLREKVIPTQQRLFDQFVQIISYNTRSYMEKSDCIELQLADANGQYRWYSYRFKSIFGENGRMVIGGPVTDITTEKEKDAQIERIAYIDSVTSIPNRVRLIQMGQDLYPRTVLAMTSYWIIVLDIDRFHLINDGCGYQAGNKLLEKFANLLNGELKQGGFAARISGDNFALLVRDTGDNDLPEKLVERIQRLFGNMAVGEYEGRTLNCSAGFARMPADGENFEKVLEHAEFALSNNRNKMGAIIRYTHAMRDTILHEAKIESDLRVALMQQQLTLYYQPKISLTTGEIVGLEALVRWNHPSGKIYSPDMFIPIAEKSQLITQVTRFVLYEACRQLHYWNTIGLPKVVMSINFTSTDFYQENACPEILKALSKYMLTADYLEIELTESLALKDIDMTISQMQALRAAGISLAMDDFGTGYSSLSYIQQLPFTMLKLDRSFVLHMEDDPVVQEIVFSVIRIAKAKQIKVIAEGVELPTQARMLREAGCDYAQGFLFGHPMTTKETEQFIRDNAQNRQVF